LGPQILEARFSRAVCTPQGPALSGGSAGFGGEKCRKSFIILFIHFNHTLKNAVEWHNNENHRNSSASITEGI